MARHVLHNLSQWVIKYQNSFFWIGHCELMSQELRDMKNNNYLLNKGISINNTTGNKKTNIDDVFLVLSST